MKTRIFKSTENLSFIEIDANRYTRLMYENGFEATKISVKETNNFLGLDSLYTVMVTYMPKEKPVLRRIRCSIKQASAQIALEQLENFSGGSYVDIDVCEFNSVFYGLEANGVVLF